MIKRTLEKDISKNNVRFTKLKVRVPRSYQFETVISR